jgi:subtilisin family serine protease
MYSATARLQTGLRGAVLAAGLLTFAACSDNPTGPPPSGDTPTPELGAKSQGALGTIPGEYIVVFRDEVSNSDAVATSLAAIHRASIHHTYSAALKGFAATMSAQTAADLGRDPRVAYIEPDQVVQADGTQQMDAAGNPWGLDRIDQHPLPLSGSYTYATTGSGVFAYIIDTGIQADHPQFALRVGSRAQDVFDVFGGTGKDCNGHGTHVAGTVGGKTYGVAKSVKLRGVKVLDCTGHGTTSGVIAGVNWVLQNHLNPAVANLSLGGGKSTALNTAVNNLANAGVFVAVAAGNDNLDACTQSPSSATAAFTTAASTKTDHKASFSNFGSCVDGYAPGVSIKSAWIGGITAFLSGTSMASPHVTGVAALYKQVNGNQSSATINTWIKFNATQGSIIGNIAGTPNRLLFKSAL